MSALKKYDPETQARAVRMYADRIAEGDISQLRAREEVGELLGINQSTLRSTATPNSASSSNTTAEPPPTERSPRSPTNSPRYAPRSRPWLTPSATTTRNYGNSPATDRITRPNPDPRPISRISARQCAHGVHDRVVQDRGHRARAPHLDLVAAGRTRHRVLGALVQHRAAALLDRRHATHRVRGPQLRSNPRARRARRGLTPPSSNPRPLHALEPGVPPAMLVDTDHCDAVEPVRIIDQATSAVREDRGVRGMPGHPRAAATRLEAEGLRPHLHPQMR